MPFRDKIKAGRFVVLGEFEPPKGSDFSPLLSAANLVRGRLDAIVVPEMASAVLKASSLGGCAFFQREGIETVFQVTCRDRNRLALQADLLAAAGLGIKNVMAVAGEDIRFGDHPHARGVDDLNLIGLLETIQKLQTGKDMAGVELRGTPQFCVGSTLDTGVSGGLQEIELEHLNKKLGCGVEYLITNPIFDLRRLEQFLKRVDTSKVAVIPTVLLLKSAGMARYIDRNIRGISIPPELIRQIQAAPDKVSACIKISGDLVRRIKNAGMAGVLLSTVGWEDRLPSVLDEAGL